MRFQIVHGDNLEDFQQKVQEALENVEQSHGWRKFLFDPTAWLRQMKFSPALAAVLLIVGFVGGIGTIVESAAIFARATSSSRGANMPGA